MDPWFEVEGAGDLASGRGKTFVVGGRSIALFNDGGEFLAVDDACPHQGASLGEGLLHDGRVVCPWHSWVFELRSGRCPRETHDPVRTYPARCRSGTVEVCIESTEPTAEASAE